MCPCEAEKMNSVEESEGEMFLCQWKKKNEEVGGEPIKI